MSIKLNIGMNSSNILNMEFTAMAKEVSAF
jgi:hypothetical protein